MWVPAIHTYIEYGNTLAYIHSHMHITLTSTCTHAHNVGIQPRDPCPSYKVISYNFTITERDTDRLVTSVLHTSNASLFVDSSQGLVANQIYLLTIEAENTVGSTISEDILLCKFRNFLCNDTNILRLKARGPFRLSACSSTCCT